MIQDATIRGAARGDTMASMALLEQFENYINRLCMRPVLSPDGRTTYAIDTQMKAFMQEKLLRAASKFRP